MVIKFRAWDKLLKKLVYELDGGATGHTEQWDINEVFTDSGLVFMQYTGLKDKNGKEIYEGDIIIPDRAPYCQGVVDGQKVVVEWLECGSWYPFADNEDGMIYPNPKLSVIVGNIYENPELVRS